MATQDSNGKSQSVQIPAVAYVRMSGDNQEDSPEQQRAEIAKLAERGGYSLLREYFDEAISGDATEKRVSFQQMRDDCQFGGFKAVLCWDQDRFGRFDPIEAGYWIKPFRDAGVVLHTCSQGRIDWNELQGRLVYIIQQEGKHAYLKDLSRNTLRGRRDGAQRGEWMGGPADYGYTLQPIPGSPAKKSGRKPKRLVPDPEQAAVVRRIFDEYGNHSRSLRDVAGCLNADDIPTSRGARWCADAVRRILVDEVYLGTYVWNAAPEAKYNHLAAGQIVAGPNTRKTRNGAKNPDEDVMRIADNHESLIARDLFDRCQRRLVERRHATSPFRSGSSPYLLSGLCRCGNCGAVLIGQTLGSEKTSPRGYMCAGYKKSGTSVCQHHYIREEPVVHCLVQKLQAELLDVANLDALRNEIRRQCQPAHPADDADRLQARIVKLSKQIDTGAERILTAPDSLTATLTAKLESWQKERDDLKRQLQAHQQRQDVSAADVEQIIADAINELETLRETLHDGDSGSLRDVLREFVSKIELWFDWKEPEAGKKRGKCVFRNGFIHLRPDLQIFRLVPSADVSAV
jgi:site-specific DNA recombinase